MQNASASCRAVPKRTFPIKAEVFFTGHSGDFVRGPPKAGLMEFSDLPRLSIALRVQVVLI